MGRLSDAQPAPDAERVDPVCGRAGRLPVRTGLAAGRASPGPRLCGVSYSTLMAGASRELGDQGLGLRFGAWAGPASACSASPPPPRPRCAKRSAT
ncbi:hypothetical protein LP420_11005 [Massilia sp. B-10]|nr:hypothetical protein LP420_11005 [Massilia sp. B-10]